MNDNLADTPAHREHPESHGMYSPPRHTPPDEATPPRPRSPGVTAIWLAIYLITAVLSAFGAVLTARAVNATGMETATSGGATFLAVLALAISVHRFLQDR